MNGAWIPDLFLDQESSDVQLRMETSAGECERVVPGHGLVLRTASKVFKTMLEGDNFKEGRTGVVDIKLKGDMQDAVFFLKYLYTKELEILDLDVYIHLLQTAHLYEVEDLVEMCNQRIAHVLTPLTVCRTYGILKNVASTDLLVHCKNLMLEFAFLIFRKDLHLFLDEETMSFLLASDNLNVLDEEQALIALWRWGCARRGLQNKPLKGADEEIGKFLPLLRAPLIGEVDGRAPWMVLWEEFKSKLTTDTSYPNPPEKTEIAVRKPDGKIKLGVFSEVAYLFRVTGASSRLANGTNNCLLEFSVGREILLSGITIQVRASEDLSQYTFQVHVNRLKVSQVEEIEKILVCDHSRRRAKPVVPTEFNFGSIAVEPYEIFRVYELLINFRKPVLLQKTVVNVLTMDITPDPKTPVYLTTHVFTKKTAFDFGRSLQFRAQNETVAVCQIRYFL